MKWDDTLNLESLYCEILQHNLHILEEMFTIGSVNIDSDFFIVAYKSKLWVINPDYVSTPSHILKDLGKDFQIDVANINNVSELFDTIFKKWKHVNTILYAEYKNNEDTLIIDDTYYQQIKDKVNSTLVTKVSKVLAPSKITYKNRGEVPVEENSYFHGTCAKYLTSILKKGLDHNTTNSNHGDDMNRIIGGKIFLTTNYNYAAIHARNVGIDTKTKGVIIEISLPDNSFLHPDYDVDKAIYLQQNPTSDHVRYNRAMKDSKEMGVLPIPIGLIRIILKIYTS